MKTKAAAILTPAVIMLVPTVQAQGYQNNNPFAIRAGAAYLTDSTARNALSNFGFFGGLGYDLPFRGLLSPKTGQSSIDLDYAGFRGNGNQFDSVSLLYVERVPFSQTVMANETQPYWGLGVGVFRDQARGASGGSNVGSVTRTSIGGEIILGVKFQQRFFIESAFHFRQSIDGVSPNSISLAVGMHF